MRVGPNLSLNIATAALALGTAAPLACTRPETPSVSTDAGIRTTAPRLRTVTITGPNDPLLVKAHEFLSRLSATPAYNGIVEPLDQIRLYMTSTSDVYDKSYQWRVLLGDQETVMGISVTWEFTIPNGPTVTVVDYHTPSEVPLAGVSPQDFPAFWNKPGITMVEVQPRSQGYDYYSEQGFSHVPLRYHHIATEAPLEAILMLRTTPGVSVSLPSLLEGYARVFDKDGTNEMIQRRLHDNLRELRVVP